MPQVEVTFNIDANGIVNVSAKDLGTGKEQQITITASTNLSKEEVERMVRDAEASAAADKAKREEAEIRNTASSLIYSTEKSLKEVGDKADATLKTEVEAALGELKKVSENGTVGRGQGRDREAPAVLVQAGRGALQADRRLDRRRAGQRQRQRRGRRPRARRRVRRLPTTT